MKRKATAITLIIVISLLVVAWLFILHTNNGIPQNNEAVQAKITAFTVNWGGLPPIVGVTMYVSFNLTVQNTGTEDLYGLNITVERIANDSESQYYYWWYYHNGTFALRATESAQIRVELFPDLGSWRQMIDSHQNFLATLSVNGTVLDERKLF